MEGVGIRLWVESPVRYQEAFATRDLDDCVLDHSLYALPGPPCSEKPATEPENKAKVRDEFKILLDVVQFRPEDIIIQIFEGWLIIKGEHGRRMDEHGFISRSFTRSYKLPTGIRTKDLFAVFCHDGILAVEIRP
ncbi:heat shock protein beta-3 [Spea bombifrons]|uniref:heat shock protein beta-3 n=1 Tax=Spea bombifrons TaxID=233779 RepID=UPI00234BDB4E|nr:heat shock protein beta-3 [Spea bombifrons]